MAQHKSLTDPDLHEPKGIASVPAGMVYVSDGNGSGTWVPLLTDAPQDGFAYGRKDGAWVKVTEAV